jgi:hypothetical protein
MCFSTNKSLIVSFWREASADRWTSQNILDVFPLHSFDHMIMVHDNSSWHKHPGYKHFIWIHVEGQLRLWFMKRFILPSIMKSYKFLWIVDDDAQLTFASLHYQCVVERLNIPLSAPGRLNGTTSHNLTKVNTDFIHQIGRWTDFVETGPVVILSSAAWQCIYMYLDPVTGSGWGLDLIWCNIIATHCLSITQRKKACAIIDAFIVHHQSNTINSLYDGEKDVFVYKKTYNSFFAKHQNIAPLANDNRLIHSCNQ